MWYDRWSSVVRSTHSYHHEKHVCSMASNSISSLHAIRPRSSLNWFSCAAASAGFDCCDWFWRRLRCVVANGAGSLGQWGWWWQLLLVFMGCCEVCGPLVMVLPPVVDGVASIEGARSYHTATHPAVFIGELVCWLCIRRGIFLEKWSNSTHHIIIETASHGPVKELAYPIDTLNPI